MNTYGEKVGVLWDSIIEYFSEAISWEDYRDAWGEKGPQNLHDWIGVGFATRDTVMNAVDYVTSSIKGDWAYEVFKLAYNAWDDMREYSNQPTEFYYESKAQLEEYKNMSTSLRHRIMDGESTIDIRWLYDMANDDENRIEGYINELIETKEENNKENESILSALRKRFGVRFDGNKDVYQQIAGLYEIGNLEAFSNRLNIPVESVRSELFRAGQQFLTNNIQNDEIDRLLNEYYPIMYEARLNTFLAESAKQCRNGKDGLNESIRKTKEACVVLLETTHEFIKENEKKLSEMPETMNFYVDQTAERLIAGTLSHETNINNTMHSIAENARLSFEDGLEPEQMQKIGSMAVDGIIHGISSKTQEMIEMAFKTATAANEAFRKTLDTRIAGENISEGAAKGVQNKTKELAESSAKAAKSAETAFKKALKIKSPSLVMHESGQNFVEGIVQGILDTVPLAEQVSEALAMDLMHPFDASAYTNGLMASAALHGLQNAQMFSNIAAQMQTAPVHVHVDLDGKEIANATALPMSYALENLRVAEMRG